MTNPLFVKHFGGGNIVIRGIGTQNAGPGGDPGAAFYVDGHYLQWSYSIIQDFFDVERIEVLRGPQGTLYGRNATGGAVNIITKKPTEEFSGELDVLVGDYEKRLFQAAISGPITDKLSGRIAVTDDWRDGYVENIFLNESEGNSDYTSLRGMLNFRPTDNLDILLTGFYYGSENNGIASVLVEPYPLLGSFEVAPGFFVPFPTIWAVFGGGVNPSVADPWKISEDDPGMQETDQEGVSLDMTWDLDSVIFKSLTAYSDGEMTAIYAADRSSFCSEIMDIQQHMKTFSQEFQLLSSDEARHKWVVGLYYYYEDSGGYFAVFNQMLDPINRFTESWTENETNSVAIFGQLDFKVTDRLTVTGGLRYTYDQKEFIDTQFTPIAFVFDPVTGGPLTATADDSWSSVSGKLGINYDVTDEILAYAAVTRGYKSGGFNGSRLVTGQDDAGYEPEFVNGLEAGLKNVLYGGRMQLNLAGFYYDYKDMIVDQTIQLTSVFENAASATILGVELEWMFRPVEPLTLDATVAYLDGTYDEYISKDTSNPELGDQDLSGNILNQAPEWSIHLGAQYALPLPNNLGTLTARGDFSWVDDHYLRHFNMPTDKQEAYHRTDAKLMWESPSGAWYGELFVRNIEDDAVALNIEVATAFVGSPNYAIWMPPRTYGLKIAYRW